jgi:chemotaxis protein methyltransferase CheR
MKSQEIREFKYTTANFNLVSNKLYALTGIKLSSEKDSLVYGRLARRLRKIGLDSFDDYLEYLAKTPEETEHFINALTTNLTAFYREPHHFKALADYVLENRRPLVIWCAACSTGEEAYSIGMTLVNTERTFQHHHKIIASDIDSNVLEIAQKGIYPLEKLASLSPKDKTQFFHKGVGKNTGYAQVVKELKHMIQFKKINLTESMWLLPNKVDIIFCRNVMIYFDRNTQREIITKMVDKLAPEGLYIAGHSETFNHCTDLLTSTGKTVYTHKVAEYDN